MNLKNKSFLPLAAIAVVLALMGCQPQAEESIEERVLARWNYMIEREFAQAWEYYTPGYRQTMPRDQFEDDMKRRPIRWYEAELNSVECQENRCSVTVDITYRAVSAPHGQSRMRLTRPLSETWVRMDDQWWYSPR